MKINRFVIPVLLIVCGSLLAFLVQTDGGSVHVSDVRFVGKAGNVMSGLLYRPVAATADNPAPAILAVHGYINTRETQSGFAIEFARRGFVVLALDQTGHGYSDPPAFANGFGGPDGLAYLRSLPFVDNNRIGLEGHSMGGWTVQIAAAMMPSHYTSMVLLGSSPGTFGAPAGTADTPKNLLVVFSLFDEFSAFMWGAPVPSDVTQTEKMKTLFGTSDTVRIGEVYGQPEKGTARKLLMPAVTHPGDHLSRDAIGAAVAWFLSTLTLESTIPPEDQVWYWKELGTLVALLGFAILVFPLIDGFRESGNPTGTRSELRAPGLGRLAFNILFAMFLPILTFFPLQMFAPAFPLFPQQITNGIVMWVWGTGLIMLLSLWWWFRTEKVSLSGVGLPFERRAISEALKLVAMAGGALYLIALGVDFFWKVDFRFWVVALKVMSNHQMAMFLIYLPFFTVFFVVLSISLATQMPRKDRLATQMVLNGVVLSGGFVVLLIVQYVPLLMGGTMTIASQPLLTIVAFQFVPVLFFVGLLLTFCYERTGNLWTGSFIVSILVTWYVVAGTATQALPVWM